MAVSTVLLAVGAFASITFEPPVKVGVSGEPGYCYGFGSETKATPSIVCGMEDTGDTATVDGGKTWAPVGPCNASIPVGKMKRCQGTINELFHMQNGSLRTVELHGTPRGQSPPSNSSWVGTTAGFTWVRDSSSGALARIPEANHTTSWTGLPHPSYNGGIRLHQQGSVRVRSSACAGFTGGAAADDEAGCLLQTASVLWGGIDATRSESLVLFSSLDEGTTYKYHATIALAVDFNSTWEGPGNENSIARLSNGSLVAVLRMKFDTFYTHSLSLDGTGRTWTLPTELPGMGCCRPRLLRLGVALLLTGGRCTPTGPAENNL